MCSVFWSAKLPNRQCGKMEHASENVARYREDRDLLRQAVKIIEWSDLLGTIHPLRTSPNMEQTMPAVWSLESGTYMGKLSHDTIRNRQRSSSLRKGQDWIGKCIGSSTSCRLWYLVLCETCKRQAVGQCFRRKTENELGYLGVWETVRLTARVDL